MPSGALELLPLDGGGRVGVITLPLVPSRRRLCRNSKKCQISARHAGPGSVIPDLNRDRDDGSGIQLRNTTKRPWIPGQARNDKTAVNTVINLPEGMSSFIQSVSPDWIKKTLCDLCVPRPPCEQGEAGGSVGNISFSILLIVP